MVASMMSGGAASFAVGSDGSLEGGAARSVVELEGGGSGVRMSPPFATGGYLLQVHPPVFLPACATSDPLPLC